MTLFEILRFDDTKLANGSECLVLAVADPISLRVTLGPDATPLTRYSSLAGLFASVEQATCRSSKKGKTKSHSMND